MLLLESAGRGVDVFLMHDDVRVDIGPREDTCSRWWWEGGHSGVQGVRGGKRCHLGCLRVHEVVLVHSLVRSGEVRETLMLRV
jgi:hypothetical protein